MVREIRETAMTPNFLGIVLTISATPFTMVHVPCKSNSVYVRREGVEPLTKSAANRKAKTERRWTKAQPERASRSRLVTRKCVLRPQISVGYQTGARCFFVLRTAVGSVGSTTHHLSKRIGGAHLMTTLTANPTEQQAEQYFCVCCGNPVEVAEQQDYRVGFENTTYKILTCQQPQSKCPIGQATASLRRLESGEFQLQWKVSNHFDLHTGEAA
jgi:hypothetical protein